MRIAALTCRSFYSLLRGAVSVLRWVQKVAEYGYGAVALADVNSMSGVVDLCKAADKVGIRPVIGVEILTERQRAVLLAADRRGYRNLCRITTARHLKADFDLVERLKVDNEGVICICSEPRLLGELKGVLRRGYLFAGCRDIRGTEWAMAQGVEPIAWTSVNWLEREDIEIAKLLARIRQLSVSGSGPDDPCGFGTLVPAQEFEQRFRQCPRALANADRLVERCGLQLLGGKPILPRIKLDTGTTGDRELARLCHVGLAKRYHPASHEVIKRLEYELTTVRKNGFSDYFLVVHEIVNFAKRNGVPVEVRGSAAGALIAHVLGFTRVCPIENRLYFERFMNPGRTDCPDIDIDLCWRRRDEIIRFCYEHWGCEHVAMVCNINRYRLRSAIRDVGRAMGLEPVQINQLAREGKIKQTSPVYRLAQKLVGIPRHLGVHCGGIVVTPDPVCEIAPLERANKGVIITQYDKDAAEAVGLVKIDLLGNRLLSTVNEAIHIITASNGKRMSQALEISVTPDGWHHQTQLGDGSSWRGRPALASRGHPGLALPGHGALSAVGEQGQDALATKKQGQDALATKKQGQDALATKKQGQDALATEESSPRPSALTLPPGVTQHIYHPRAEPALDQIGGGGPSEGCVDSRFRGNDNGEATAHCTLDMLETLGVGRRVAAASASLPMVCPSAIGKAFGLAAATHTSSWANPNSETGDATNEFDSGTRPVSHTPSNGTGDLSFDPNDGKTARMLSAGDCLGVFQSESPGMRQLLRGLKVKSKKDLAIALSLIRPGPASGGMKSAFIDRHVHGKPFTYLHPKIAKLLGDTYGVMLYQEDVMRIAVEVAGYTVAEADRFRSEVSKSVSPARVQAQYVDFVHRKAEQAGIERKTAEAIWDEVLRFAAYSYCKAHATVYANIAWETAWLKAHYPAAFYCSLFNNHQGMYPLRVYVWDARRHGVPVLPPHVNHSEIEWSLQDGAVRAGLNTIKGLCGSTARTIIEQRVKAQFRDLDDLRRRVRFRKPELQNLIHVGACDSLGTTRPAMLSMLRFAPPSQEPTLFDLWVAPPNAPGRGRPALASRGHLGLALPGCDAPKVQGQDALATKEPSPRPSALTMPPVEGLPDYDGVAKLEAEIDVTGIPFTMHPAVLLPKRYVPAQRLRGFLGQRATVAGFVATARRARTSDNRVMGFVTIEDATGLVELSFFPDKLPLYKTICSYGGPVWASGKVTEHLSSLSLDCSDCGRIGPQTPDVLPLSP